MGSQGSLSRRLPDQTRQRSRLPLVTHCASDVGAPAFDTHRGTRQLRAGKRKGEYGPAAEIVGDPHRALMGFHDFIDDRKAKPSSWRLSLLASPKSLKHMRLVLLRN